MAYATLEELKKQLGIDPDNVEDNLILTSLLSAATVEIDTRTGRTFSADENVARTFDCSAPTVAGRYLYLDMDLAAIVSITNGDGDDLDPSDYRLLWDGPPHAVVDMLPSSGKAWTSTDYPEDAISIVGTWCYQPTVPDDIKQSCIEIAEFDYRRRENGADFDRTVFTGTATLGPVSIPVHAAARLEPYVRGWVMG